MKKLIWLLLCGCAFAQVINPPGTITGASIANPLSSVLTVDGVNHPDGANGTNLTTAMASASTLFADRIWFPDPNAGFNLDPFNDATGGNGYTGYQLNVGRGNIYTSWPLGIPLGAEWFLTGRASENQLSTTNGCGTATPTQCSGTMIAACNPGVAPWTGAFGMSPCNGQTFPGAVISTISRASNVVTVVTSAAHNYTSAMATAGVPIFIANTTGGTTSFNGPFVLATVVNPTTITFAQTGADESGTVSTSSSIGSPVVYYSDKGNGAFGSKIQDGTITCSGVPGCVGILNTVAQEHSDLVTVSVVGWQAACLVVWGVNTQNFHMKGDIECLAGAKTGATIGIPPSAVGTYWNVNAPSTGIPDISTNPRGTATTAPIKACVWIMGTQGGFFRVKHCENAQVETLIDATPQGLTSRDIVLINTNTASVPQSATISTISRNGSNVVSVVTATPHGAINTESVTISGVTGGATSFNGVFTNLTVDNATTFHYTQTGPAEAGGVSACSNSGVGSTGACANLSAYALTMICGTSSTLLCNATANVTDTVVIGQRIISPNITVYSVVDDVNSQKITQANWTGSYFQSPPLFGTVLPATSGGTGASAIGGTETSASTTAYVVTGTPVTSLTAGLMGCFVPNNANGTGGGLPTVAFNGLTAKQIVKLTGASLAASDMVTTQAACVVYNGSTFYLLNPQGSTGAGKPVLAGTPTLTTPVFSGVVSTYNGITLGGQGLLPIAGVTSQKAETTTADANVLTVTPAAAAGTYRACVVISVSSATAGVIGWTLSWTDSNGTAQSNIAQSLFQNSTAAPALTFTTSAAGNYQSCSTIDVNAAAASIIVKWVGGGTTAAKISATVERLI